LVAARLRFTVHIRVLSRPYEFLLPRFFLLVGIGGLNALQLYRLGAGLLFEDVVTVKPRHADVLLLPLPPPGTRSNFFLARVLWNT
jgi:hypothetical protein